MNKVERLKEEIRIMEEIILKIQNECSHPESCVTSTAGSNTGNYDPHADSYWWSKDCSLCQKHWTEDQ